MYENVHTNACHCKVWTRKQSTNSWGVRQELVTLKKKTIHRIISDYQQLMMAAKQ